MHLDRYKDDILKQFSSSKRRDYRYSLKNDLIFRELTTKEEIADYYRVLLMNLKKLGLNPVHSLDDLYDLKFNRFFDQISFYGVYKDQTMIAGSMIFLFDGHIMHTQYLSSDEEYLNLFPMDFLIENLIQTALNRNCDIFTFGICTEDLGHHLNLGLSRFKEGFGTEYCINRSYELKLLIIFKRFLYRTGIFLCLFFRYLTGYILNGNFRYAKAKHNDPPSNAMKNSNWL